MFTGVAVNVIAAVAMFSVFGNEKNSLSFKCDLTIASGGRASSASRPFGAITEAVTLPTEHCVYLFIYRFGFLSL